MKIDYGEIRSKFREFWKRKKDSVKFVCNGKPIIPEKVSSFDIQPIERDDSTDLITCNILNLKVQVESVEKPYIGNLTLKIEYSITDGIPTAEIIGITDNTVYLKNY